MVIKNNQSYSAEVSRNIKLLPRAHLRGRSLHSRFSQSLVLASAACSRRSRQVATLTKRTARDFSKATNLQVLMESLNELTTLNLIRGNSQAAEHNSLLLLALAEGHRSLTVARKEIATVMKHACLRPADVNCSESSSPWQSVGHFTFESATKGRRTDGGTPFGKAR